MVPHASANHDETRFFDSERFDVIRDVTGHVAFDRGLQSCLGVSLAGREARAALGALLEVLPGLERADDRVQWIGSWLLGGPEALPVERSVSAGVV